MERAVATATDYGFLDTASKIRENNRNLGSAFYLLAIKDQAKDFFESVFSPRYGNVPLAAISDDLIEILNSGQVAVPYSAPVSEPVPVSPPQATGDPLLNIAQQATAETTSSTTPQVSIELVAKVQAGLNSLGYDVGKVDGIAGEATATAIRKFETFYNYDQTGKVTLELIDMLIAANAKF